MTENMRAFAALLGAAEAAATAFDGVRLSRASQELSAFVEEWLQGPLSPQEFEHLREQLGLYRDLCAFMQDTLHGSLLRAAGHAENPCYTKACVPAGAGEAALQPVVSPHLQPLLRRYA